MLKLLLAATIGLVLIGLVATAVAQISTPAMSACSQTSDASPELVIEACTARLSVKDLPDSAIADLYLARASMFERLNRLQPAIDDLAQAIRKRPNGASIFRRRAALYRGLADDDRAIGDLNEAIRLDPVHAQSVFDRAELFRKKGDRRRAYLDYGAVLKLDPSFEAAAINRKALAQEIEKIGALMPVAVRPSFECAATQRAVEKAICADIELSKLDHDLDAEFQKAVAKAEPMLVTKLRTDLDSFVATRNMSFGQAGYDLRKAMERRLAILRAMSN